MLESIVSTLLYRLRRGKEKQDRVVFTASRSINYSEIRKRLACLFLVSHGVNQARARLRTLLLVVPLLLLLVAMLLLLVLLEADLVTMSVLIVGRRDTTRTRAPNCLLRTRSGITDGRYWFWPVLQSVHPQGERT